MKLLGWDGAACKGNLDEVHRLFRTGEASPTDRDELYGRTALQWALWSKQLHAVKWLVREGGSIITERNSVGWTALLWAVFRYHVESIQFFLRECGADIADVDNQGRDVWGMLMQGVRYRTEDDLPTPANLADVYSILRCHGSPTDPTAFIEGLKISAGASLPAAHRDLLLQTERAHASPNRRPYRAQRLALLHEGSDFARIVIPDLQNIVAEYAQPTAEAQLSAAVIAEAAEAEQHLLEERGHVVPSPFCTLLEVSIGLTGEVCGVV
jgi:hypothetical protein